MLWSQRPTFANFICIIGKFYTNDESVGGALVESTPFVRRVMGSTLALAATYIGTLGKSFTHSCLWRFGVKFRHRIRAVSGANLSRLVVDLKRCYRNSLNE